MAKTIDLCLTKPVRRVVLVTTLPAMLQGRGTVLGVGHLRDERPVLRHGTNVEFNAWARAHNQRSLVYDPVLMTLGLIIQ